MTSWQRVSARVALFGLFLLCAGGASRGLEAPQHPSRVADVARDGSGIRRHNEVSLARLRPGKDKLATAVTLYGSHYRRAVPDSDDILAWVDARRGRVLRIEVGSDGIIDSVTVATIDFWVGKAGGSPQASLPVKVLAAGRGLSLGDPREHILKLYGPPASQGPSTQDGRELELLFYAFDWAGSDVPQVMEVTCDRAEGRVVQITLAFPSL